MSRATYQTITAEIQRMPGLEEIPLGEIGDAINTASKDVGNQPWPWNYAETNVLVPAPYSTGTVSITDGSNAVTGLGTVWTPYVGQTGWRIRFGSSNLDYIISAINNITSITLAQVVNLGSNLAGSSYTLYKDTYFYPSDYIVGSDVALLQPTIRTRIPKIPRYKFEMAMNTGLRTMATNITMFYCDQGIGYDVNLVPYYQFRLGPPPAGPAELRLCYHSMAPDLGLASTTLLPDGYDEIITLVAASKLYDVHKAPGTAEQVKALANGKMRLLKRQIATQTIDDVPGSMTEVPDSSISQWGMMIGRMT
jgi:hypothetical protein